MYRIMLVDDDDNILKALRRVLNAAEEYLGQYMVEPYSSPIKALRRAQEMQFDLILCKPFENEELMSVIKSVLERRRLMLQDKRIAEASRPTISEHGID